jgi:hypothetical protein
MLGVADSYFVGKMLNDVMPSSSFENNNNNSGKNLE